MKKVFIKTYGCAFNQLDSQIMAGNLKKAGFTITNSEDESNLIVINSCTVKNLSETKFWNDIKKYKDTKKVIAAGCIPQGEPTYISKLENIAIIGTNDLKNIAQVANNALNNNVSHIVTKLGNKRENEDNRLEKEQLRLRSPKFKTNRFVEIIPINEGCLNQCTFCKTKQSRGNLFSYSIPSIKDAMQRAIENGAKEIYLTSQDVACYGFDINTNLSELLKELLKIQGDYKIRIGMGNPNHFKKIIDDVLEIMIKDDRIYKFLHIPLQSASNNILKEMNRTYTFEEYQKIILKARLKIPGITIANDIIVAYPKETQEEFEETIKSLELTNVLNFSRFWLRPNTPAVKLYERKYFIDGLESKRRIKILKENFERVALKNNKKWIGWQGDVLICEIGKNNTFVARNNYYKPIILKNKKNLKIGDIVKVKIEKATWLDFRGEII